MHEIGENPIRPLAAGARGVEERGERRGEPVERLPVKLELVERDVAGGLGAVGEPVDARQWERHEVDELCQLGANRREAGEVARGGDEGHAVAARGEALGEVKAGEQVAEGEPREDDDVQRRLRGMGVVHFRPARTGQHSGVSVCVRSLALMIQS
ncbi:Os03g0702400 [Oryza sativa Japonica Group]|uniref:Os03g0702400 protein n=2 Tax=Oryza sativa subsp. japonica TaxID=39947 RepID=Q0DPB5_ORYSJ|nr:hypothetical protein EE612_019900 [Oryza sativa]BAF12923.1 Os03g0702400 [Oryza sativa Japonica Group]BAS85945.1 Os03g0702400 [Oryza sativa Japonica Group]|eukprot:NP_001051009.1 Os03g0702400 [Oryza sativa Japonica Group]